MATKMERHFLIPDAVMLTFAEVFLELFTADEVDFFNFSNVLFPANFKIDFQADIDAARDMVTDTEVVGDIMAETAAFNNKKKICEAQMQELKFFVKKIFADNAEVMHHFGFETYRKIRWQQDKVVKFMLWIARDAKKYKTQLIAKGYTQAKINQLQTSANELKLEEDHQEEAKKNRLTMTRQRTIALNKPWDRMVEIHKASRVIYRDNFEKLKQYDLPESSGRTTVRTIKFTFDQTIAQLGEIGIRGTANRTIVINIPGIAPVTVPMDGVSTNFYNFNFPLRKEYKGECFGDVADVIEFHCNSSRLKLLRIPRNMKKLKLLVLQNNLLKTPDTDQVLIDANNLKIGGITINLLGNDPPSAAGLQAKAELEARGCMVLVAS